ncbi:hypothetical protein WOSG25_041490 [Weissella oryzae SG25]|uniref:Uncharacterized protein n=1 Tax=Weissella oryzae (strain DSM 25784 / JCM 18191 / LMG 30913 / SG25) TaxID=1329250 RepID=A0A069CU03_WEIOS|nr:ERF family protein [Weissella oryzae]GAK30708.1 hypothetical protein WOSG25_041490 [Weissella oryzae SG25]
MRNQVELTPTAELNADLAKVQAAIEQPNLETQGKDGHFGKYIDKAIVEKVIRNAIKKADVPISYQQQTLLDLDSNGNRIQYVVTTIRHGSGEAIALEGMPVPFDNKPQTNKSNLTYSERTSLAQAFMVVADSEDDGQQITEIARMKQDQERQLSAIIAKIKELMKLVPKEKLAAVMAVIQKKEADAIPSGLDRLKINSASMLLGAVTLLTNDNLSNIES